MTRPRAQSQRSIATAYATWQRLLATINAAPLVQGARLVEKIREDLGDWPTRVHERKDLA